MTHANPRIRLSASWLTVVAVAYFCAALITAAFHTPLLFDAASNAIIPKNLHLGYGWATGYHERSLTPSLSSGPTIMIPCAILIALLGQQLWVPALSMALLDSLLISILAYQIHRLHDNRWQATAIILGTLTAFALCDNLWLTMMVGEIPAFLLLLISAVLCTTPHIHSEKQRYFLLGITAGLAFLCRLIVIPGFGALGLILLFQHRQAIRRQAASWYDLPVLVAHGLLGILLVTGPFMLYMSYEIWRSENQTLSEYLQFRHDLFRYNRAVGIGLLLNSPDIMQTVRQHVASNASLLASTLQRYGLWPWLIPATAITLLFPWRILPATTNSTGPRMFAAALFLILAAYLSWYFPIPATWGIARYALYPMLLSCLCLNVLLAHRFGMPGVIAFMLCAVLLAQPDSIRLFRQLLTFQRVQWLETQDNNQHPGLYHYHRDIAAVAGFLQSRTFRYPLANCGWLASTPEVEFLMPDPEVFHDCYRMIAEALVFDPADDLTHQASHTARYRWKHPVNFTLVINLPLWLYAESLPLNRQRHALLRRACNPVPLYSNPWYIVTECPFDKLATVVPLTGTNPFLETRPEWELEP